MLVESGNIPSPKLGAKNLVSKALKYQSRSEFIPKGLADSILYCLCREYGFVNSIHSLVLVEMHGEFSKHRYALAILLLSLYLEQKPHKEKKGWQALSYERLKRLFRGDDDFIGLVRSGVLMKCDHGYSIEQKTCKAARLYQIDHELIGRAVRKYCKNPHALQLVDHHGKPFEPAHVGLAAYGKTKPLKVCNISKFVPIDGHALLKALQHIKHWIGTGHCFKHPSAQQPRLTAALEEKRAKYKISKGDADKAFLKYLKKVCKEIEYLLIFVDIGVPNPLQMATAGRLYRSFLQRCHKVVREVALQDMWSFDFKACHHVIFHNIAKAENIACPYLEKYVSKKAKFRKKLAKALGVTRNQAKEALIALAYGAGIRRKKHRGKLSAIREILGEAAFKKAQKTPRFKRLSEELKNIATVMHKLARKKNGQLLNIRGLPMDMKEEDFPKQIAHLVQGVESLMLKAAVGAHHRGGKSGKEVVVLTLHDGWITRLERDAKSAIAAVKSSTGIDVKIDVERYCLID